jgi:hypothetical protein
MAVKLGIDDVTFRLGAGEVAAVYLGSQEVWSAVVPTEPGAPTDLAANNEGFLYFNAPASDGGALITGYRFYIDLFDPAYEDVTDDFVRQTGSPFTFDGNQYAEQWFNGNYGGTFNIKVSAVNAVGEGPLSAPLEVTWA